MGEPPPIKLGYYCDLNGEKIGGPNLSDTERHWLIHGLNGAGKSTRFLIELLATANNRSLLVFDIKGELAWQTADLRRRYGDVYFINPHHLHGLPSHGFNPARLVCDDPMFFSHLTDIGAAAIDFAEKDKHWDESAQSVFEGFTGHVIKTAAREKRMPSLAETRRLLCAPDVYEDYTDVSGRRQQRLKSGIAFTAQQIIDGDDPALAGLVSRFVRKYGLNELASIQSTADTQTKWLLDPMMAADMSKPGVDFSVMPQRPVTIYVLIHPMELRKNRRWTRLVVSSALCALMRPGPVKALIILDEFYATVGNLPILNDVWSLVRGYGIQLMPIIQSCLQLQTLFKAEWENYAGQAGVVATLGPAGDMFTAKWMSELCGVDTFLQAGINLSDGINTGGGTSASTGTSGGGMSSNQGNSFNNGRSRGGGISWQQTERRVMLPQDIRAIRAGHGLMWLPGMGTRTIPFFAPNYWNREAPWVKMVKPNPLQRG
jgi:type IV secretion system protein VirD4